MVRGPIGGGVMKCESTLDRMVIRSLVLTIVTSFMAGCIFSMATSIAAKTVYYSGWAVDVISRFLAGQQARTPH